MKLQQIYRVTVNEDRILKSGSSFLPLFVKPSLDRKDQPIKNRICAEFKTLDEAELVYTSLSRSGVAVFRNWLDPVAEKTMASWICRCGSGNLEEDVSCKMCTKPREDPTQ